VLEHALGLLDALSRQSGTREGMAPAVPTLSLLAARPPSDVVALTILHRIASTPLGAGATAAAVPALLDCVQQVNRRPEVQRLGLACLELALAAAPAPDSISAPSLVTTLSDLVLSRLGPGTCEPSS
jgi:hypothetical protein